MMTIRIWLVLLALVAFGSQLAAQPIAPAPSTTPSQSDVSLDVTTAGVVGDGITLNTAAIQKAVDDLSARGGGMLVFPTGRYVTGTIQLKDGIHLRLTDGATLLGSHNPADYRNIDPFDAGDHKARFGYALVTAIGANHVGLEGNGTIDGQGKAVKAAQKSYDVRPFLVRWEHCTDVTVKDVHLTEPGAWTMHFFQCRGVLCQRVNIRIAKEHLINNDGIDLDSSRDVRVEDCDIVSGDDSVCIKATSPEPSRDIYITNCNLSTHTNGIKLGTESLGDFFHIRADHCHMKSIGMAGIALYCEDGAHMHDVSISDIDMDTVTVPISIRLGSRCKTFRPGDSPRPVGELRDIHLENIHAIGAKQIGLLINGIPGHPVQGLTLKRIDIQLDGGGKAADAQVKLAEKESAYPEMNMFGKTMPAFGGYLRHIDGIVCQGVTFSTLNPDARPVVNLIDVAGTKVEDFVVTAAKATTEPLEKRQ